MLKEEELLEQKKAEEEDTKKKEEEKALEEIYVNNDHGQRGNQSMFRSVPRDVLIEREDTRIYNEHQKPTKYFPNVGYVQPKIVKNVDFGTKTELDNMRKIAQLRDKVQHKIVCSKGATGCFGSVKRVQALAK